MWGRNLSKTYYGWDCLPEENMWNEFALSLLTQVSLSPSCGTLGYISYISRAPEMGEAAEVQAGGCGMWFLFLSLQDIGNCTLHLVIIRASAIGC
jgi:hypothetical protein